MMTPAQGSRVPIRSVLAGWDVPAAGDADASIRTEAWVLFTLRPDAPGSAPSLVFPELGPQYQLGVQEALPGPVELAVFGVRPGRGTVSLARLRDYHRAGRGAGDFQDPVFVSTGVERFAAALDVGLDLHERLAELRQVPREQWERENQERSFELLAESTRALHRIDPAALAEDGSFWWYAVEGLWGELDDGDERFDDLLLRLRAGSGT
ncbi:SUKH-4 family immunity protein [Actinoplanes sp. NPDC023936]|uniref:SUKH-4 family immunity protein n=1 Tax=Actinoplanes sp. NPDC023936 TaxID=3154910 RepID=UPI0033C1E7DB